MFANMIDFVCHIGCETLTIHFRRSPYDILMNNHDILSGKNVYFSTQRGKRKEDPYIVIPYMLIIDNNDPIMIDTFYSQHGYVPYFINIDKLFGPLGLNKDDDISLYYEASVIFKNNKWTHERMSLDDHDICEDRFKVLIDLITPRFNRTDLTRSPKQAVTKPVKSSFSNIIRKLNEYHIDHVKVDNGVMLTKPSRSTIVIESEALSSDGTKNDVQDMTLYDLFDDVIVFKPCTLSDVVALGYYRKYKTHLLTGRDCLARVINNDVINMMDNH